MRCLWLTRIDPSPQNTGELIYSGRLIRSFAESGMEVTALCLANPESDRRDGEVANGVRWRVAPWSHRPSWGSLLSPLPNLAYRCAAPALRSKLDAMLANEPWDLVVFDCLSVGWALPSVAASTTNGGRRPLMVYVSHNHEESTRTRVAREYTGSPLKRAVLRSDARKAASLERRLVHAADLVTAISPSDHALFTEARRGRPVVDLPPGYGGRRLERRAITAETPRRVVMVGAYEWVAKQANLREFTRAAAPAFRESGAELTVVGNGGAFVDELRREFPTVTFTGRVDDVYPYMDQARMAVVPERLGGGFKLKALDYVFNRLPIAALAHSIEGMPLKDRESVLSFPDFRGLVNGILRSIDDLDMLNRLQESAYVACAGRFEWASRGKTLAEAVATL